MSPKLDALELRTDEVHVWQAHLDLAPARISDFFRTLSVDEQARAERFRSEQHRDRSVASRGLLRAILSCYLDIQPAQLRFCYSDRGKPALTSDTDEREICFNLSHAGGLALIAVARGRPVGIDAEQIRPNVSVERIARRFFSPQEADVICALPPAMQVEVFYNCWTRTEALVKARGDGIWPSRRRSVDSPAAGEWSLRSFEPQAGYVAALAAQGCDWRLVSRWWVAC